MNKLVVSLFIVPCFIFMASWATAQNDVSILSDDVIRALNNEVSGELAQDYIRNIGRWKRDQASDEYHQAAEWLKNKAIECGFSDVHTEKYPASDDVYYYMSKARGGWDADFGELWITEPREEKLTSYAEIPVSLANRSQSCDVTGELIYLGPGDKKEHYEGVRVRGKIVLCDGSAATAVQLAVDEYGALGVVHINQRFAHDEPDIVSRVRIFTKAKTFVFNLSHRRGEELKARLLGGEIITVRGVVRAEIHPGYYENVIATIPGTDLAEEEILLTAHLCHYKYGANDNASGVAALLEIGRSINRLIQEGKIARPKRTIRFLWVPEMSGSIAYAATHPEVVKRMVAGINYDMVGQYINQNNATFFTHCTPHSQPHYINDLLINLTEFVAAHNVESLANRGGFSYPVYSLSGSRDAFRYRIAKYSGGSDQAIFNDGLLDVPMGFFILWPDRYYHTSGDKPEICDPTQLKRSSFLGAAAITYLADDDPGKARRLAGEIYSRANARIAMESKRALDYLNKAEPEAMHQAYKEGVNFIEQAYKREVRTLLSVKDYSPQDASIGVFIEDLGMKIAVQKPASLANLQLFYDAACRANNMAAGAVTLTAAERAAKELIPVRVHALKGPVGGDYLRSKLASEGVEQTSPATRLGGVTTFEIVNFIDGENSILDIRNAVSAEFAPVPVEQVREYIELLVKAGIVLMQ